MTQLLYLNDEMVAELTNELIKQKVYILQIWKHGATDQEHCKWLLNLARFKHDAHVLDIACGVGAVTKQMIALRPDLRFSLQNISPSQLSQGPSLPKYQGTMTTLAGVPDEAFDAAMVCYALGHVDKLEEFFVNVARVLKPKGEFFVYDIEPLPGQEAWALTMLGYNTYPVGLVKKAAKLLLLTHDYMLNADKLNVSAFENVCGLYIGREIRKRTKPVAYRFVKR